MSIYKVRMEQNEGRIRGYDPRTDGDFVTWFGKFFLLGLALTVAFCVWLCHMANVKAERELPSKRQGTQQLSSP